MSEDHLNPYETMFHHAHIGIARVGADGSWLEVNDKLCKIVGYSREELLQLAFQDITHPDDLETEQDQVRKLLHKELDCFSLEQRYVHKQGKTIWIKLTVSLIRDASDNPDFFVSTVEDITAQREAQQQLRERENYQRALLDNFPFLIWLKDTQSRFLSVNEPFAKAAGYACADELTGKSDLDIWPEDLAKTYRRDDREVLKSGHKKSVEEEVSINGDRRWFETYKAPFMDDRQQILGTVGFARDITERKRMEQDLIEKEYLLREAQSVAHLGNWELDPVTLRAKWSDEIFSILKREPTEDVGPDFLSSILHPEDRDAVINSLANAVADGSEHHMQYRIFRPDGEMRWLECQAVHKYDQDHRLQILRGVIQDITLQKEYELKLQESEKHFRALFEQMPSAVAVFQVIDDGHDFVFLDFNSTAEKTEHIGRSQLIGKRLSDVFPGVQTSGILNIFQRVHESGETDYSPEFCYRDDRNPGSWRESWVYKLADDKIVAVYNDITQRKLIESRLRTLSQAIEQSPVSVVITDPQGLIEYVNGSFESVTGYSLEEVKGKNPKLLKSGQTPKSAYRRLWQAIMNGQPWEGEFQNRKKNGDLFWEYAHIAPVVNDYGTVEHFVGVKEDITLRKQNEEQILHQAHFDSLTDLPNRFLSMDRLSQLLNEAKRSKEKVGVLFIDLDDFKKINDTLGHEAGDKVLIEAAQRLLGSVRSGDTVGRLSGDEFIVLLSGLSKPADAQFIAEKMLENFRRVFEIDGRELIITASIGIAISPDDSDTTSGLLRNADSAMYHSKESGRNTFSFFTEAMNQEVSKRLELEEQIHGALERGEFTVHYQPLVKVSTGQVIGAEALLRWHNPALGCIPPSEFIPVAEQTGLIIKLGEYILEEALTRTAEWQRTFASDLRIAVNISPRQFLKSNLFDDIKRLLNRTGVQARHLELEITEGVLMSGHSYVDETLDRITRLGIHVAMDDFGTGYSSLSYLRSYPFHILKIDQSFIHDIGIDQADRELIIAAISMAHGLNLEVIAEGVESEQQLEFLKAQSCDCAQGYLFSKPLSRDQFTRLLETKRTLP